MHFLWYLHHITSHNRVCLNPLMQDLPSSAIQGSSNLNNKENLRRKGINFAFFNTDLGNGNFATIKPNSGSNYITMQSSSYFKVIIVVGTIVIDFCADCLTHFLTSADILREKGVGKSDSKFLGTSPERKAIILSTKN